MAIINDQVVSFNVPENARDVSNIFYNLGYPKTPFLNEVAIGDSVTNTIHHWWEKVLMPSKSTVAAGHNYTASDGQIYLTSAVGVKVGSLLKITNTAGGTTLLRVSAAPNYTTGLCGTVVVVANDGNAAAGCVVEIMTNAQLENAAHANTSFAPKAQNDNVTQIMTEFIEISATEQAIKREVDPGSLIDKIAMEKMELLYFQLSKLLWNSYKVSPTDNLTPRVMGGLLYYIGLNGYCPSAATFSTDNLDAFLLAAEQDHGADISELWMNPIDIKRFRALDDSKRRLDNTATSAGTPERTVYLSDYGYTPELHTDPQIPPKSIVLTDPSKVLLCPLQTRQMQIADVMTLTDGMKKAVVGEYTLEVNPSNRMGIFLCS